MKSYDMCMTCVKVGPLKSNTSLAKLYAYLFLQQDDSTED